MLSVKHSYARLPKMCDYRTDRRMDRQTPDKVIPMCRYASQATQSYPYVPLCDAGDTKMGYCFINFFKNLTRGTSYLKCYGLMERFLKPQIWNNVVTENCLRTLISVIFASSSFFLKSGSSSSVITTSRR